MTFTCPKCGSVIGWSSDCTFEDMGYEGNGIVQFYECINCGVTIEVCIPEDETEEK